MSQTYHLVLSRTPQDRYDIVCLEHGYQELAWIWCDSISHREALVELKRMFIAQVMNGNSVRVSECFNFQRLEPTEYRDLDIMDDTAMALEVLSR